MSLQTTSYELMGGLDLVTPGIRVAPGRVLSAKNYEPSPDGYRRIEGYERFDGRLKPSLAQYWLLRLDRNVTGLFIGDHVTGGTSGAIGQVLTIRGVDLVLWQVEGDFAAGEAIIKDTQEIGLTTESIYPKNAHNDADDMNWRHLVQQAAREEILPVPGSGPIRGMHARKGVIYAFRDNEDGDACILHKATEEGWVEVEKGRFLTFTDGTRPFYEGEILTGANSGATGTIIRMIVEGGDWGSLSAVGRLAIRTVTGDFQEGETINATSPDDFPNGSAKLYKDEGELPLNPGGQFQMIGYNFYGKADHFRLYGVDGVNPPFELVDDLLVPIKTNQPEGAPTHIAAYRNHLFLSYPGGAVMHSGVGEPHAWKAELGASELSVGDDVTGLLSSVRNNLMIFCRNKISILSGSSPLDWNLQEYGDESGAIEGSVQKMFDPIFLDDRGVRSLATTDQYGDFKIGSYSKNIDPWIKAKRGKLTCSMRVRKKDQYRLFFEDGAGLILDISKGEPEFMPVDYPFTLRHAVSVEDTHGEEVLLASGDDGYLYELDAGVSFDGQPIDAFLRLPFVNLGSPTQNKRFLKATIELDAEPNTDMQFTADFSYGNPELPAHDEQAFQISGSGAFWDNTEWNDFYWSSQIEGTAEAHLDGFGTNLSMVIMSTSDRAIPHSLHGVTIHWSPRGLNR